MLERNAEIGGNWCYGQPNSRVYASTHTISSKRLTEYTDFQMPGHFPNFPHHSQVFEYLRAYAEHFGLYEAIEFQTPVERVEPDGPCWKVTLATGQCRRYGGVVVANGHNWDPRWPEFPGHFAGQVMHSAEYKTPDVLRGRRVMIVGAGNTGCDLAVEAAQSADKVFHSLRRGYYFIPKFLFGRPSDVMGEKLLRLGLPEAIATTRDARGAADDGGRRRALRAARAGSRSCSRRTRSSIRSYPTMWATDGSRPSRTSPNCSATGTLRGRHGRSGSI